MELGKPWIVLANVEEANYRVASTWYDTTQRHFVALLEGNEISQTTVRDTQDVRYQVFPIPSEHATPVSEMLVRSAPITVRLPTTCKDRENNNKRSPIQRCIPVLAKLSLDHTLLALQYTDTIIRIVPCSEKSTFDKQWTLDVSISTSPIMVSPVDDDSLGQNRSKVELGQTVTSILPGGIIWSDHGGNSQDLVVITTKAVLCYKVSLQRKSMSATHAFSHPVASAVWWEPCSRAILVGSYSTTTTTTRATDDLLIMRAFFLHFPPTQGGASKLRPFRLELPPPDRIDPFAVGQFRTGSTVSVQDIVVVSMYGNPYCVELGFFEDGMGVTFYRLDRKGAAVRAKTCLFTTASIPRAGRNLTFIAVLDNVTCVHSMESNVSLFLDVMDLKGESEEVDCAGSVIDQSGDTHKRLLRQTNVSFISPCYILNMEGNGHLYPLSLDLRKAVSGAKGNGSSVPFLLRRSNLKDAHQLVVDDLIQIIDDEAKMNNGKQTSIDESVAKKRQNWIDAVVAAYGVPHAYTWDERASVPLMFKCALLPAGSEFHIDTFESLDSFHHQDNGSFGMRPPVLTQTEILERALLPLARHALASSDNRLLIALADVALDLFSAFAMRPNRPCPALECLLIALLWRLGKCQDVLAMVRASAFADQKSIIDSDNHDTNIGVRAYPIQRERHRVSADALAEMIIAIITTVPAGCGTNASIVSVDTDEMDVDSAELMEQIFASLSRLASYRIVAKFLLSRGRLIGAMSVCLAVVHNQVDKNDDAPVSSQSSLHLVVDGVRGQDFFPAAVDYAYRNLSDIGDRVRFLFHLHAFFKVWDPQCLEIVDLRRTTASTRVSPRRMRHLGNSHPTSKTRARRRRPSAVASLAIETHAVRCERQDGTTTAKIVRQSWLAHYVPCFPDSLFGDTEATAKLRDLFGYSVS